MGGNITPRRHGPDRGFTMLEMVVVIVVVGIISSIAIPAIMMTRRQAKIQACWANKATINAQVELWHARKGTWPFFMMFDIGSDSDYFPDGLPKCPVNGTPYWLNPFTHRVVGHEHDD